MGGKRKYNKFAQRKRDKKEQVRVNSDIINCCWHCYYLLIVFTWGLAWFQALNPQPKQPDVRKHYAEIVRENATFEAYYKVKYLFITLKYFRNILCMNLLSLNSPQLEYNVFNKAELKINHFSQCERYNE